MSSNLYSIQILGWTPMVLEKLPPIIEPAWVRNRKGVYVAPREDIKALVKTPFKTRIGLVFYYPLKRYRYCAMFRILSVENLQDLVGKPVMVRIERMKTIYKRPTTDSETTQITILPLKKPVHPRYKLIITAFRGKRTGVGSVQLSSILNPNDAKLILTFYNSSSGTHWIKWYVIVAPLEKAIRIRWVWSGPNRLVRDEVREY